MRKLIGIIAMILTVAACSHLPSVPYVPNVVYRPPVQQGNIISSKTVAQLSPGMTQEQVIELLGEPVLKDPYNDNRWYYVYSYVNQHSRLTSQKRLTLYFSNGVLTRYTSALGSETSPSEPPVVERTLPPKKKKPVQQQSASENNTAVANVAASTPPGGPSSGVPEITLPTPTDLMH